MQSLYKIVAEQIRGSILGGEYRENEPLPSERYLTDKHHVSRSTVRQALNLLKKEDVIYTVHGNGSFVKPQVFEQPLNHFYSFTDGLKASNTVISNEIYEYTQLPVDAALAAKLEHPAGAQFHRLVRIRSAVSYPLMIETTWLPKSRFHRLETRVLEGDGSLYDYLSKKYDLFPDSASETFCPVLPTPLEQELLKVGPSTPCIRLERISREEGAVIEYTSSIVRGDKFVFKVDMQNNQNKRISA